MIVDVIKSQFYSLQEISLKKIYDELTEDIFDMSNVRIFIEIEKEKMGDAYTFLCLWSVELSKMFGLRNLMIC